jgi:hypothetical protein
MPTMIKHRRDDAAGGCGVSSTNELGSQDVDDDTNQYENDHPTPSHEHSSNASSRITTPTKDIQSLTEEDVLECPPPPKATHVPMVIKNRMLVLDEKRHHANKSHGYVVIGKASLNKLSAVQERASIKTDIKAHKTKLQLNSAKASTSVSWLNDIKLNALLDETTKATEEAAESSKQNAVDGRTRMSSRKRNGIELGKGFQPAKDPSKRKPTSRYEISTRGVTKAVRSAKKTKVNSFTISSRTQGQTQSSRAIKKNALRLAARSSLDLKPLFEVNDKVFAPWYLGTITHYETVEINGKYGPIRYYTVLFEDDMSEIKGIIDACVFDCKDYQLSTSQGDDEDEHKWVGVENVLDKKSTDMWAKSVGWYETCIGELLCCVPFLSLAMKQVPMKSFKHQMEKSSAFLSW